MVSLSCPHHFTEITLIKVTNDTCPTGLLYGIWHCWTLSCMTLPCFSYLNYWSFQGSLAFSYLCVLPGQSHSLNTYNNSTLTLMTSRSAPLQWCPKPHSPAPKPDDTSFLLKVCSFSCPSDRANNASIYLVHQALSILVLLYFSLLHIFILFHYIVI